LHARGLSRFAGKYFSSLELRINYFLNVDSGVVGLCSLLVLSEFGVLVGVPRGAESRSGRSVGLLVVFVVDNVREGAADDDPSFPTEAVGLATNGSYDGGGPPAPCWCWGLAKALDSPEEEEVGEGECWNDIRYPFLCYGSCIPRVG